MIIASAVLPIITMIIWFIFFHDNFNAHMAREAAEHHQITSSQEGNAVLCQQKVSTKHCI